MEVGGGHYCWNRGINNRTVVFVTPIQAVHSTENTVFATWHLLRLSQNDLTTVFFTNTRKNIENSTDFFGAFFHHYNALPLPQMKATF